MIVRKGMPLLVLAALVVSLAGCSPLGSKKSGLIERQNSALDAQQAASIAAIVQYDQIHSPEIGTQGMVVSQNSLASQVGYDILAAGGNAVDAAVATAFALAVTLPRAGNLGGSGFLLHRSAANGKVVALDFRSAAPAGFQPQTFRAESGATDYERFRFGAISAGVPGTVAGLWEAWERFGSLPWEALVRPAERLAQQGIPVSTDLHYALQAAQPLLSQFASSRETYLRPDGDAANLGRRLYQRDLAASLAMIRRDGADTFYRGELARQIVDSVRADGGVISLADLADYRVRERDVLKLEYRGYHVHAMPPVSGGGVTLLQMLNTLAQFDVAALPQGGSEHLHLLAEVMKQGAASRRFGIGDPDFVDVDTAGRLSAQTARSQARKISQQRALPVAKVEPLGRRIQESRDTTQLSVVDAQGNAVSLTYTLGYSFGSGYVAQGTGILLDNQMQNFYYDRPDHANGFRPGKRMMSTMTPTIVTDADEELFLVTGTPGGSRIVNVVLQLLVNSIDYGMDVAQATHAPRIHHNWSEPNPADPDDWSPPDLQVEAGISIDVRNRLREKGHVVSVTPTIGSSQSIMQRAGRLFGAADPRRPDAKAIGVLSPAQPN